MVHCRLLILFYDDIFLKLYHKSLVFFIFSSCLLYSSFIFIIDITIIIIQKKNLYLYLKKINYLFIIIYDKNLVLRGGGTKIFCFLGVIKALEEHGILDKGRHFTGSSAGSIMAAFYCLGYNVDEI